MQQKDKGLYESEEKLCQPKCLITGPKLCHCYLCECYTLNGLLSS